MLLSRAAIACLADMAFIDAQIESDMIDSGNNYRRAFIDAMAPLSCRIEMTVNDLLRDKIVDTLFYGADEGARKKSADDSLLEMLNVIAGSFLSAYFGPGTDIQLSLPRFVCAGEEVTGQEIADLGLNAEGQPVRVTLSSVRYRY
jgi:hypothetical protein